jgi:hypothetical protein
VRESVLPFYFVVCLPSLKLFSTPLRMGTAGFWFNSGDIISKDSRHTIARKLGWGMDSST